MHSIYGQPESAIEDNFQNLFVRAARLEHFREAVEIMSLPLCFATLHAPAALDTDGVSFPPALLRLSVFCGKISKCLLSALFNTCY